VIDMGFLSVIRRWALRDKMPIREIARPTAAYPRNRQTQQPLQGQITGCKENRKGDQNMDRVMNHGAKLRVKQSPAKTPQQFSGTSNSSRYLD
jgi:hypothetical protein